MRKEIEIDLKRVIDNIAGQYPNYCRVCYGRGGLMRDWYSGCIKFFACHHCVSKGLDSLDTSKEVLKPKDYGLYCYNNESKKIWEVWSDDLGESRSALLGWCFNSNDWENTLMGKAASYRLLLMDLRLMREKFNHIKSL
jgi:hypothetical protein